MSVINLTTENFEEEVLNAKEPVLVDFWATWCGPCQTMGPVVDELAQELTDVKVGKVNSDISRIQRWKGRRENFRSSGKE